MSDPGLLDQAIAAFQAGDSMAAERLSRAAGAAPEAQHVLGLALYRQNRLEEALAALALAGDSAECHSNQGAVLRALGRPAAAEAAYRRALARNPDLAEAHGNLGNALRDLGRQGEAVDALARAVALRPDYVDAHMAIGNALHLLGRLDEAESAFRTALRLNPGEPEAWAGLGLVLMAQDRLEEARQAMLRALALRPDYVEAHANLGALMLRAGGLYQAEAHCRRALDLSPDQPQVLSNLGVALQDQGRLIEAEAMFRRALAVRPDYPGGHGSLLFCLNYRPDLSAEAIFAEYRRWNDAHAARLLPARLDFANDIRPDRRLRIGYVSPDFRQHAVSLFLEPMLAAHDPELVEIFLYAELALPDDVTARYQEMADHWRPTMGLSDADVVALIRRDGVDILVDLAGHTALNRLLVFAAKPAPIQISYLIGHGYTTGLRAIDGFLADAALAPPGSEALFSERLLRLSRIPLAYRPPDAMPAVNDLPALSRGYVTFGCFTRLMRINDRVIAAWVEILRAVPDSRLMLNARPLLDPAFQADFRARFTRHGIDGARLDLVYTYPQAKTWAAYGDIDIALDAFPHNAGTTTIEALWMGVPVVSKADRPSVGRFGAAILGAIGLDDWVAVDEAGYVARAVSAAADLVGLARLRSELRARFKASPLLDAAGLTGEIEGVYRDLWRDWCGRQAGDVAALFTQGNDLFIAGRPAEAAESYRRLLALRPDLGIVYRNLSAALTATGQLDAAEAVLHECLARDPADAAALVRLGSLLDQAERLSEAAEAYRQALDLEPGRIEARIARADLLRRLGQLSDAEAEADLACAANPPQAEAFNALGNVLLAAGKPEAACGAFDQGLALRPDYPEILNNRALARLRQGLTLAAERDLRAALALQPDLAEIQFNLATALQDQGRQVEAESAFRLGVAARPTYARGHGSLLFCLNYSAEQSAEAIFAEYRRWDAQHAQHLAPLEPSAAIDPNPKRRLRIGYVSADFKAQSAIFFIAPLLAAHDRAAVEIFLYGEIQAPDAQTQRFRALADHWRPSFGLSDADLARLIRQDRIDVLIDLGGHTADNRLLVFARRPAPIQIAYLIGHGYSTGLSAMDAFIADAAMAPPGAEALFAERLIRLDRIPLAYEPPGLMPAVTPLPALARGHVTFGCFSRLARLNPRVIAAWAEILRRVPGARLLLNAKPFAEPDFRTVFAARLAALGVDADRLDLVYTVPQPRTWAAYGAVDIALDPFPHNAGTGTIEALWLGVPVVSLADRPSVGRFGASILGAVGLEDWVASDVDSYIDRAVRAARDLPALGQLRQRLRARVAASPLCDATGLARALERLYRDLVAEAQDAAGQGVAAYHAADLPGAIAAFQRAARQQPQAENFSNLGAALRAAGRLPEAEAAFGQALALRADFPEALSNLGNVLLESGRAAEAEARFRQAIALRPDFPDAWYNLGNALYDRGQFSQAGAAFARALVLKPDSFEAARNLGSTMAALGYAQDALRFHRRALEIRPDYAAGRSSLLFNLNYRSDLSAEAIFAEYQVWDRQHAQPLAPVLLHHSNPPDAAKRLRIGYVSADFRGHSVAVFAEPLLAAHDRAAVELFAYADIGHPDATTERLRGLVDHWRPTIGLSDARMAEMVRRDGIDVLVDLGGHSAGNRLLVFARKPAPVQVSYLLGHGYTSGLSAIDGFLADAALAPPGSEALFSETIIRLERIPLVYQPPSGMPPVGALPALAAGHVTFGCFSRTVRINDRVIAAWARILAGVPGARLLLNAKPFAEAAFRREFALRFLRHGVDAARLDLVYTTPQSSTWAAYGAVDIALDPFPHNAGTTTIEALWLGIPVVSLADRPSVGRFGAMILGAVGLADWVAGDVDAYIAKAVAAAGDLAGLAALRAGLRARVAASPLRDAPGLARAVEQAYRTLWRDWCRVQAPPRFEAAAALFHAGRLDEATALVGDLLIAQPGQADLLHLTGLIAYRRGEWRAAGDAIAEAVAAAPQRVEFHSNLAAALRNQGRLAEAEQACRAAIALDPAAGDALNNLGNILMDGDRQIEAEACFRRAVALDPQAVNPQSNLAFALSRAGRLVEAEAAARAALALDPDHADAWNHLGNALSGQDRLEEACAAFARAVALRPDFAMARSNLLFCLNYRIDLTPEAIFAEYRGWAAAHAAPVQPKHPHFANDRDPKRRLRIGYVSADFRHHAVSFFLEPLLAAHDRAAIELFCYAEVTNPDAVTRRFQALADHWRPTIGLSDAALAAMVRDDAIDILVDLGGHTHANRLLVFARRPAPVQLSYFIGHGYTTGLDVFDGLLVSAALAPPGSDHLFSEKLIRLPRVPLAYRPPDGMPDVAPLPALSQGHVTFGCFSRTLRINERVIAAWAEILTRVPGARLLLNNKPFAEPAFSAEFARRFAQHGIAASRLDLVYTTPQSATWAAYGRVDLALDPFPHNAGTTTVEALWQGVPVVSLADRPSVGRFGAMLLGAVGLEDWVAEDVAGYIAKAAAAAADLAGLARLRAGLRAQVMASPLTDAPGLARVLEAAYRQAWQDWCARTLGRRDEAGIDRLG